MENTLITQDRLDSLVQLCKSTKAETIAEVGVYKGGSLKFLAEHFSSAVIFGFDTFEGLPKEHWHNSEVHKPGDFDDTDIKSVYEFIDKPNVVLVQGLFPKSAKQYKDQIFDFVHIDTDFYKAVSESIAWFWPRMSKGGIIVFDDYKWPNCPGVKKALDECGYEVHESVKYQAYIKK
jgi:O-methyltransferase